MIIHKGEVVSLCNGLSTRDIKNAHRILVKKRFCKRPFAEQKRREDKIKMLGRKAVAMTTEGRRKIRLCPIVGIKISNVQHSGSYQNVT
jgi:hypothetical protein